MKNQLENKSAIRQALALSKHPQRHKLYEMLVLQVETIQSVKIKYLEELTPSEKTAIDCLSYINTYLSPELWFV